MCGCIFHFDRALDAQLKAKHLAILWRKEPHVGHAVRLIKVNWSYFTPPPLFISYMFKRLMKTSGNGSDSGPCGSGSRSGSKWLTLKKKIIRKVASTSLAMSYKFIQNIITPFNSKCLKDSYFSASSVRFTYGTFTRLFYVLVLDPDPHLFMRIRIRNTSWAWIKSSIFIANYFGFVRCV